MTCEMLNGKGVFYKVSCLCCQTWFFPLSHTHIVGVIILMHYSSVTVMCWCRRGTQHCTWPVRMHMLRLLAFCYSGDPHQTLRTMWVLKGLSLNWVSPQRLTESHLNNKVSSLCHCWTVRNCFIMWHITKRATPTCDETKDCVLVPGGWHLFACGCTLQQHDPGENPVEFIVFCHREKPGTGCHINMILEPMHSCKSTHTGHLKKSITCAHLITRCVLM